MIERRFRILQVSTHDCRGGAASVAWNLFRAYRGRGYGSWLAVGQKDSHDPDVLVIPNRESNGRRKKPSSQVYSAGGMVGADWFRGLTHLIAEPRRTLDRYRGREDFCFPGTAQLLQLSDQRPDIVHCHNLHGGYFDLRMLPWLSQEVPLVLTLHDGWLLTGHCAHSLNCERWRTGCGQCPDLTLYPAIRRDATAYNWGRKLELFQKTRAYIATPCRWLMQKVENSILSNAIIQAQIIPNGVDLSIFHPTDKQAARAELTIRPDYGVILFAAEAVRNNVWKDYQTARDAIAIAAKRMNKRNILLLALGEDALPERIGQAEVRFVPYQTDPKTVARYYQAADVYVHAARVDTFPSTVLEALACGTPVVATAVGGIPEQIEHERTGFLVPTGDAQSIAHYLTMLLTDSERRRNLGELAAEAAIRQFDVVRQVNQYIGWYDEILQSAHD
jgi:glycosyltransferase involved in cell wall biosynthesis